MKLNSDIAELLGIHTGDGTLYKTTWGLVWEVRGDLKEKEYYKKKICPLLERIFGLKFTSKFRSGGKNGCWGVQTSKKEVTQFFLDYGFNPGKKSHTVKIPQYIFKASKEVKCAFIKGLFDTDGCIRFDKIKKRNLHTYPRLEFGFASKDLIDTLKELLNDLNFSSFTWEDKISYRLCLAGNKKLEKWLVDISPNNLKHLDKIKVWKKFGYYPQPKTF